MGQYNPYYKQETNEGWKKAGDGLMKAAPAVAAVNPYAGAIVAAVGFGAVGTGKLKTLDKSNAKDMVSSYQFNGDINQAQDQFNWQDQKNPFDEKNVYKDTWQASHMGSFQGTAAYLKLPGRLKEVKKKRKEFAELQAERKVQAQDTYDYLNTRYDAQKQNQQSAAAQDDYMSRRYQNSFQSPQFGQSMV